MIRVQSKNRFPSDFFVSEQQSNQLTTAKKEDPSLQNSEEPKSRVMFSTPQSGYSSSSGNSNNSGAAASHQSKFNLYSQNSTSNYQQPQNNQPHSTTSNNNNNNININLPYSSLSQQSSDKQQQTPSHLSSIHPMKLSLPVKMESDINHHINNHHGGMTWTNPNTQSFEVYASEDANCGETNPNILVEDQIATQNQQALLFASNRPFLSKNSSRTSKAQLLSPENKQRSTTNFPVESNSQSLTAQIHHQQQKDEIPQKQLTKLQQQQQQMFTLNPATISRNITMASEPTSNIRIGSPKASISYNPRMPLKAFVTSTPDSSIPTATESSSNQSSSQSTITLHLQSPQANIGLISSTPDTTSKQTTSNTNNTSVHTKDKVKPLTKTASSTRLGSATSTGSNNNHAIPTTATSKRVLNQELKSSYNLHEAINKNAFSSRNGNSDNVKRNLTPTNTSNNKSTSKEQKATALQHQGSVPLLQSKAKQINVNTAAAAAAVTGKARKSNGNNNIDFSNFKMPQSAINRKIKDMPSISQLAGSMSSRASTSAILNRQKLHQQSVIKPSATTNNSAAVSNNQDPTGIISTSQSHPIGSSTTRTEQIISPSTTMNSLQLLPSETEITVQVPTPAAAVTESDAISNNQDINSAQSVNEELEVVGTAIEIAFTQNSGILNEQQQHSTNLLEDQVKAKLIGSDLFTGYNGAFGEYDASDSTKNSFVLGMNNASSICSPGTNVDSNANLFSDRHIHSTQNSIVNLPVLQLRQFHSDNFCETPEKQKSHQFLVSKQQFEDMKHMNSEQLMQEGILRMHHSQCEQSLSNQLHATADFTLMRKAGDQDGFITDLAVGSTYMQQQQLQLQQQSDLKLRAKCQPKIALNFKESEKFKPFMIRKVSSQSSVRTKQSSVTSDGGAPLTGSPSSCPSYQHFVFDFNKNNSNLSQNNNNNNNNQGKSHLSSSTTTMMILNSNSNEFINSHEFSFSNS